GRSILSLWLGESIRIDSADHARELAKLLNQAALDLEKQQLREQGLRLFTVESCDSFEVGEEAYILECQESGVEVGLRAMKPSRSPHAVVGNEWGEFDYSFKSIARARLVAVDGWTSQFVEVAA
ncbi:hypothetical protein, partial [Salinibacterium sp.]|uniref:hypothetical protein n=1 Tax=Salinibacterium sp. TaxID=1915057 RepID=UPI00286C3212